MRSATAAPRPDWPRCLRAGGRAALGQRPVRRRPRWATQSRGARAEKWAVPGDPIGGDALALPFADRRVAGAGPHTDGRTAVRAPAHQSERGECGCIRPARCVTGHAFPHDRFRSACGPQANKARAGRRGTVGGDTEAAARSEETRRPRHGRRRHGDRGLGGREARAHRAQADADAARDGDGAGPTDACAGQRGPFPWPDGQRLECFRTEAPLEKGPPWTGCLSGERVALDAECLPGRRVSLDKGSPWMDCLPGWIVSLDKGPPWKKGPWTKGLPGRWSPWTMVSLYKALHKASEACRYMWRLCAAGTNDRRALVVPAHLPHPSEQSPLAFPVTADSIQSRPVVRTSQPPPPRSAPRSRYARFLRSASLRCGPAGYGMCTAPDQQESTQPIASGVFWFLRLAICSTVGSGGSRPTTIPPPHTTPHHTTSAIDIPHQYRHQ